MVVVISELLEKITFRHIISPFPLVGRLFSFRQAKGTVKVGSVFFPTFP